jgi:hypothetical protein
MTATTTATEKTSECTRPYELSRPRASRSSTSASSIAAFLFGRFARARDFVPFLSEKTESSHIAVRVGDDDESERRPKGRRGAFPASITTNPYNFL